MLAIDGLGIGGAEMVVRDLAHLIDRDRFQVCVCCTKGLESIGEGLRREGIDVFVLPQRKDRRVDYLTPFKFWKAVRDREVDVVHTHAPSAFWDAALCKLMVPRLKVVHTFHYGNYPNLERRTLWMERWASRIVDRLIAVGWQQRHLIQAAYHIPDSRIDTVWNGATPASPEPASSFRAEVGTGDRLLVGTLAKLIPQKGLEDLLSVARRCCDAGHRMQFVVLGEGPLRPQLEQRRLELGLDDTVVLAGWLPNAAARALPAFDVFFQPSRWEAMSIAVLEAMAAGKAVLATRVGDNPRVLDDGETGLIVESGDIDAMVDALARLRDHGLRHRLGVAARATFEQQFTVEHMTRAYERVYAELVGA